jgi:hypothetical protein
MYKISSLIGNTRTHGVVQLGGVTPSWATYCVVLTDCILPLPPHFYVSDVEKAVNTVSAEEQFLSTQCRCHCLVTHWFSLHHHHFNHQLHLPSSSYPEKSKLNLFQAVTMLAF